MNWRIHYRATERGVGIIEADSYDEAMALAQDDLACGDTGGITWDGRSLGGADIDILVIEPAGEEDTPWPRKT